MIGSLTDHRHRDLIIGDAVKLPIMGFRDIFDQINRVKVVIIDKLFGQCHGFAPLVFARRAGSAHSACCLL